MGHFCKFGSTLVVLCFIYFLGISGSNAEDMTDPYKVSSESIDKNITRTENIFPSPEAIFSKFPTSVVPVHETTTNSITSTKDNLRKRRQKKGKKKRRRTRKGNPVITISRQQPDENGFGTVTTRVPLKRKIRKRTRKSKKRRRKPKEENANILEIVTARVPGPHLTDATFNKSAIYGIMKRLNENPEKSLDELKRFYANTTLNFSSNEFWMDNSVDSTKKHVLSKIIENLATPVSSPIAINERIQQTAPAKQKTRKRRRKHRKRRPKLKPRKTLGISTAIELHPPEKLYSNNTIENLTHIYGNNTISSSGSWLENLVEPVPNSAAIPKSLIETASRRFPNGKNNVCRQNRAGCAHICNPEGPSKCSCLEGFFLAKDRRSCYDLNECKVNNGGCEMTCINTLGSYECQCPKGLRIADDLKSCEDVNECLLRNGHGPCQDTCENTHGSYKCSCARLNGTKLSDNGYSCEDVNECTRDNGGCSHECINTMGRAFCNCPYGLELSSDWKTCQDINECENEDIRKSCDDDCINTLGSYRCVGPSDLQNDQPSVNMACNPLFPPTKGFITCSRKGTHTSYTQDGRERIANSPGTVCELVCPIGSRMFGEYLVTCGIHGKWEGRQEGECKRAPPPQLQCPPSKHFKLERGEEEMLVEFPSPITEINWKYVKSNPTWAKDLMKTLGRGTHNINFTVRDPSTKMFSSCSFDITVSSN